MSDFSEQEEEQNLEIEALEAIFPDEFKLLSPGKDGTNNLQILLTPSDAEGGENYGML